jgi:hypothetical protein
MGRSLLAWSVRPSGKRVPYFSKFHPKSRLSGGMRFISPGARDIVGKLDQREQFEQDEIDWIWFSSVWHTMLILPEELSALKNWRTGNSRSKIKGFNSRLQATSIHSK